MGSIDLMKLLDEGGVAVSLAAASAKRARGYLRLAIVENRPRQAIRQIGRCLKKEVSLA